MALPPPEDVVSARLVRGYAAEGEKWCWETHVRYPDQELYRTFDEARHGVEGQRQRGQGKSWNITSVPAVLARGTSSILVFSVSSRWEPLPTLGTTARLRLCDLLSRPESRRPRLVAKLVDSQAAWKPCGPRFHKWVAESASGSSLLNWIPQSGGRGL